MTITVNLPRWDDDSPYCPLCRSCGCPGCCDHFCYFCQDLVMFHHVEPWEVRRVYTEGQL